MSNLDIPKYNGLVIFTLVFFSFLLPLNVQRIFCANDN